MSDRLLALAVMDSIERTTGHVPRPHPVWPLFAWFAVGIALVAGVILGG